MAGRPKSTIKTVDFDIRVPRELKSAVCRVARSHFTTPSQYVRDALRMKLDADSREKGDG